MNQANQPQPGPLSENISFEEPDVAVVYGVKISGALLRALGSPTPEGIWIRVIKVADGCATVEQRTDLVPRSEKSAPLNSTADRQVEGDLMALVDEYADAFHGAMRPDGGIQFADGLVAKGKKDALRAALRAALNPRDSVIEECASRLLKSAGTWRSLDRIAFPVAIVRAEECEAQAENLRALQSKGKR